jgi:transcriptional regulator with XRE-family HTH domain
VSRFPILDKRLAAFLTARRGQNSFKDFAKKLGISPSTLFRLVNGQQSATLAKVEQIMRRLNCSWQDIFGP